MPSSITNEPYTMRQARKDREYVKAGGKCPASYTSDAIEFQDEIYGESTENTHDEDSSSRYARSEMISAASRLILLEGPVFQVVARVAIFYQGVHPEIQTTRFLQRYPG